jgi:hypothetical protein
MFREECVSTSGDMQAWSVECHDRHHEIDRALRTIARQRCALDAEEAQWLRAAEAEGAWKKLGYVHGLEYLEDVFGYRPRTAKERLRVARELGELPELEQALGDGELSYSIVRELSRVAKPTNVGRWIERARGKNLREVEQMVSGRQKGDDPDDAPDPDLVEHGVWLELDAVSLALFRDLRKGLEEELGRSLEDKQLVAEVHARVFESSSSSSPSSSDSASEATSIDADDVETAERVDVPTTEPSRRHPPRRMIHISTCPDCRRAWQDGAGLRVQIDARALERARCDAVVCDQDRETRATQDIPERIRRKVMERDGWRCTVPGCRSARNLEAHHIRHREHGGDHDPTNITTLCGGHHDLHHDEVLTISGQAPDALVFMRGGRPIGTVGAVDASGLVATDAMRSRYADVEKRTLAKAALQQAGFRAPVAKAAVEAACEMVGPDADLTALIKQALRYCATSALR